MPVIPEGYEYLLTIYREIKKSGQPLTYTELLAYAQIANIPIDSETAIALFKIESAVVNCGEFGDD